MSFWQTVYKKWNNAFAAGSVERSMTADADGAGITQNELDINGAQGLVSTFRDAAPAVDLSKSHNRIARLKEYQRLLNMPEISQAMNTIANEACIAGQSKVETVFDGKKTIQWLTERWNKIQEPFLVYCYDFKTKDYTIGWAHHPRIVKQEKTVKIVCSDGSFIITTLDHRILKRDGVWSEAGRLSIGDELMPFYRLDVNTKLNDSRVNLFPRIFTHNSGWLHERHFLEKTKTNGRSKVFNEDLLRRSMNLFAKGHTLKETAAALNVGLDAVKNCISKYGMSIREIQWLGKIEDKLTIEQIVPYGEIDVYDMTVDTYENFCCNNMVVHNCQLGDNGHVLSVSLDNKEIQEELEHLLFSRHRMDVDNRAWTLIKKMCSFGEVYLEAIIGEDEYKGILKISELPQTTMFRKETIKGRLLGFMQSDIPDSNNWSGARPNESTTSIEFTPEQIIHIRINEDNQDFYPYGTSMLEIARSPAYLLKMMEDAMVIYRLSRAPERRVFYIDTGEQNISKSNAFIEQFMSSMRRKKVPARWGMGGAESADERFFLPSPDEDIIVPIRANSQTRIDTLSGAQNLDQIQDIILVRQKLYVALGFPENYMGMLEPGQTRITLSAQDARFARMIERVQQSFVRGIYELCERHLRLMGYPEEEFQDLFIKMTPPSDWRTASQIEVLSAKWNLASSIKNSGMASEFDINTKILGMTESDAKIAEARNKLQKLEDMKLQILGQNPEMLGYGIPGSEDIGTEMGVEAGGPNPMLGPDGIDPEQGGPPNEMNDSEPVGSESGNDSEELSASAPLPEPSDEDIRRYDLEIIDYDTGVDAESDDLGLF